MNQIESISCVKFRPMVPNDEKYLEFYNGERYEIAF